jgi:hypothetical protein
MKPAEKVLRSCVRSQPTDAGNVNIFNVDGVLTRDCIIVLTIMSDMTYNLGA